MNGLYTPDGVVNKNALWEKYGYLVRHEALKLQVRLPANVDLDDLIQVGAIGLLSAVDSFDPKKGIALGAYITQRVRWALIDELRERDWVPRRVRSNAREISAVIQRLEQEKGHAVTEHEIAENMGVSLQQYQQMLSDTNVSQLCSLDELQQEFADSVEELGSEQENYNPLNELMLTRMVKKIGNEISQLPEREQLLLNLYYQQDLNMKEIGILLGVTETRVSQLHSQAIKVLRARMEMNK